MILANRWLETWAIVEARNLAEKQLQEDYDLWLDQISLRR